MIIAYLNQKGGVGKTTLAIHTASAFALADYSVVLVDADPQGSALDWLDSRKSEPLFPVVGMPKPVIHRQLPRIAATCDIVVIDGPPSLTDIARSAMLAADLVVIPVQPSPYDVWAAEEVVGLVEQTRVYRDDLLARFVISRRISNTVLGRDVVMALERWSIPVLPAHIYQRIAFAETAASGSTVLEAGRMSLAAMEIEALRDALLAVALEEERMVA